MSGKIVRTMLAALLALVLTVNVSTTFVSTAKPVAHSTLHAEMERGTTGS